MVLVLVIADANCPILAIHVLPPKLAKLLVSGKIQHIFSLGNMGNLGMQTLKQACPTISSVAGSFDTTGDATKQVTLGGIKFLLCGKRGLDDAEKSSLARIADADICLTPSDNYESLSFENRFFVSPGSARGATIPTAEADGSTPSFVLMDVGERGVVCYVYRLLGWSLIEPGELKIEKVEWSK